MVGWLSIQTRMRTNTAKEYVVTKSVETEFRFVIYFFVTFFVKSISQKCNCPHIRLHANKNFFFQFQQKEKNTWNRFIFFKYIQFSILISVNRLHHYQGKKTPFWKAWLESSLCMPFKFLHTNPLLRNLPPEVLGEIVFSGVTEWPGSMFKNLPHDPVLSKYRVRFEIFVIDFYESFVNKKL